MKKVMFFVTAAAVAMSSLAPAAFASSPTYSYFDKKYNTEADNIGAFGVPKVDKVTVGLDMQSRWSTDSNSGSYSSHSGSAMEARVSNSSDTRNFDSMAYLDMENVGKEWNAYINAALDSDLASAAVSTPEQLRELIINTTTIEGTFDIVITYPSTTENGNLVGIENKNLISGAENAYTWPKNEMGYSVTDFFELDSQGVVEGTPDGLVSYKITMKAKPDINEALDTYFTAIEAAPDSEKDKYRLEFEVLSNTVGTVSNSAYEIDGEFSGSVTINVGSFSSGEYTVMFGDDGDYSVLDSVEPATDNERIRLVRATGGGGGGGTAPITTDTPSEAPTESAEPSQTDTPGASATHTPAPLETEGTDNGAKLNYDDHYAYIIGYDVEGGPSVVRPENNITRAEVATIFFRMLTDDSRAEFWTKTNSFSDVSSEDWFNNAISTTANAGIVNGYDTGDFKPNAPITRAEFAAIAARFSSRDYTGANMFNDISGHWAAESINKAAQVGWITGYEDGSFRPNQYITRAEAMTLINRVLYRLVDNDGVGNISGMVTWPDNTPDKWYYAAVQEATNSHYYEREDIGYYETWTEIREPRDWAALETSLSNVTDAGEEESIFFDEDDIPSASPAPEASEEPSESPEPDSSEEPSGTEKPDASESPEPTSTPVAE